MLSLMSDHITDNEYVGVPEHQRDQQKQRDNLTVEYLFNKAAEELVEETSTNSDQFEHSMLHDEMARNILELIEGEI